ncbi:hypothetical protein [Moheibacter sediminis]|uniref:Uncharacterized protein n=1 Tax=Moheibacter sediminis TaxID=1434700 RepID=A0A1W1ZCM9_9FLAO|nr:hypothetical protein [Moheibacter sediminis]SMC46185.1 hypothetical protein SAMN06296427_102389 [Moheibacter sediminis]
MAYIKYISLQMLIVLFVSSCAAQRKDKYFDKIAQNKDLIKNLSLEIQNKLNGDSSRHIALSSENEIFKNEEIMKFKKDFNIFSIHLWRTEKTNKDSIIIYSTDYNPFIGNRRSIIYCFSDCDTDENYIQVNDNLYYRKHKKQFY